MNPFAHMPLDADTLKWLSSLGVGGVIAGFMFVFYRKDRQSYIEASAQYAHNLEIHAQVWREDRRVLMELLKSTSETLNQLTRSIDANTAAVTWLIRNQSSSQ